MVQSIREKKRHMCREIREYSANPRVLLIYKRIFQEYLTGKLIIFNSLIVLTLPGKGLT